MKLNARILRSEAPVNSRFVFVASLFISFDLSFESLFVRDAATQTLPRQDAQFDLSHIKPTAMLGREVKLQLLRMRLASAGAKVSYSEAGL